MGRTLPAALNNAVHLVHTKMKLHVARTHRQTHLLSEHSTFCIRNSHKHTLTHTFTHTLWFCLNGEEKKKILKIH